MFVHGEPPVNVTHTWPPTPAYRKLFSWAGLAGSGEPKARAEGGPPRFVNELNVPAPGSGPAIWNHVAPLSVVRNTRPETGDPIIRPFASTALTANLVPPSSGQ